MAPAIAVSPSLTSVNLYDNSLKNVGVSAICEAVQGNKESKLAALNVGYNSIGPDGAKAVAALCSVSGSLTKLDARLNGGMGADGKAALRKAVEGRSDFDLLL